MNKVYFADICEMMENKYIKQSEGKFSRLDFAMLALHEPALYDSYVFDFIKELKTNHILKEEGNTYEIDFSNPTISSILPSQTN